MSAFKRETGGPVQSYHNNTEVVIVRATGGGAATALTLASASDRCVATITNRGVGQYRINFRDVPAGTWLGMAYTAHGTADTIADAKVVTEVRGSYDSANSRVDFTVANLDATPALEDLATTEGLTLFLYWAATAKP